MLDDLHLVDWNALSHPVHGEVGSVPIHLRGLLDENPMVREQCFQGLFEYLVGPDHQLLAQDLAVTVVPFLLQITESEEPGRGYAALLLCALARAARMARNTTVRDVLETHRDAIRSWTGPALIDARAYLLSCLDRFETPEDRPERKVLRALWRALSEETAE
jgi:hypothetical protein